MRSEGKIGLVLVILLFCSVFALAMPPSIAQVSYSPSPAVPGTQITVLIQLENNESTIKENVIVHIDDNYPFSTLEESEKNIGDIDKFGKALVEFKIYVDPSAENESYTIPVKVSAKNQPTITTDQTIIVSGKEPSIKVISVSDERLIPGQEKIITLEIQNLGTSTAYDIIVELQEDRTVTAAGTIVEREITPLGPALDYISQLQSKQKQNVDIKVSVNREADLKNYTLPVKITFRDSSGANTQETSYIGFKVSGTVNIDAAIKEVTPLGAQTEITVELFNKGVGKAEFTIVEVESNFGEIEKSKQFIGALEPNDVDSFKIKITPIAVENKELTLNISYQDTDSTQKQVTLKLPVDMNDGQANQSNPVGSIILLIIIVVLVYLGWRHYKKKKKR
ncbi:MAG: hypothetical protein HOE11_01055 [Candidatus Diapherotrites archaeon]|mgnify:FL=1|jgi:hypothetical protein|nr:hypothetical protein [Candidatus Diapherotrites archaeon]MBT4597001.1 hypothetical protein [Candidatus Diapherotrites archaeon]